MPIEAGGHFYEKSAHIIIALLFISAILALRSAIFADDSTNAALLEEAYGSAKQLAQEEQPTALKTMQTAMRRILVQWLKR